MKPKETKDTMSLSASSLSQADITSSTTTHPEVSKNTSFHKGSHIPDATLNQLTLLKLWPFKCGANGKHVSSLTEMQLLADPSFQQPSCIPQSNLPHSVLVTIKLSICTRSHFVSKVGFQP